MTDALSLRGIAPTGPRPALALALILALVPAAAWAQLRGPVPDETAPSAERAFHIKPSDVALPPGAKPGAVKRMIQPFGPWTLICDETVSARTRVCNASQSIVDAAGRTAFSWSLAATRGGSPVFVLRAAVADAPGRSLAVTFGRGAPVEVALPNCDATLCIGFLPVTADIQRAIKGRASVHVQLAGTIGSGSAIETTLDGLSAAIASIR